tara:strand:- start:147 stop:1466 length:1320 start_codon:yes stop_codon:yes gene_type:complete
MASVESPMASIEPQKPSAQPPKPNWRLPVLLLSLGWALAFSVLTSGAATLNLAGAQLSSEAFHSTALAVVTFSAGFYNLVLPKEIASLGRWRSYLFGAATGCVGCLISMAGCEASSMAMLCLGGVLTGVGLCHGQNFRFGVTLCLPDPELAPVAISWVMAGGIIGALLGPEYARHARDLLPAEYSGVFAVSAAAFGLLFLLLLASAGPLHALRGRVNKSDPTSVADADRRRPLRVVYAQPRVAAATFVAAISYAVMVFLMAALPLSMKDVGHTFDEISGTIQAHMVAMFLPSFGTGHLVRRFGAPLLEVVGAALMAAGGAVMLAYPRTLGGFAASQSLVGVGWNFAFVAATSSLQKLTRPGDERTAVQSANDVCVFGLSGASALLAASALDEIGWSSLHTYVLFLTCGAIVVAVFVSEALARRTKSDARVAAGSQTCTK